MEISIKLSSADIEKMLGRIYGFKEGSVKVFLNGNGEIIATASEFPQPVSPNIFYGSGVRNLDITPNITTLSGNTSNMDPNVKVTCQKYDAMDSNLKDSLQKCNAMAPNDGCSISDSIMDRHFGKYISKVPKNMK